MSGSKHDADCLRRKAEMGWLYLCTCQMTDDDVDKARESAEDRIRRARGQRQNRRTG